MNAEAIRAGLAYIEMGLRDEPLQKGLDDAEKKVVSFADAVKGLASAVGFGAIAAAMKGWVSDFAAAGAELYNTSQAAGVSIADLTKKAQELGFSGFQGVAMAKDLADAFDRLKKATQATFVALGEALAPAFTPVLDMLTQAQQGITQFIQENRSLVQVVGLVVGAGASLAAALSAAAPVIHGLETAIGALKVAWGALMAVFSAGIGIIGGVLSFVLSPIGLITVAVSALIYYIADLGSVFQEVGELISKTWGGIVDAFMAGDLALAGQIAIAALKVAWLGFRNWFMDVWNDIPGFFNRVWQRILDLFHMSVQWLQRQWQAFLDWLQGSGDGAGTPQPTLTPEQANVGRAAELANAQEELNRLIGQAQAQRAQVEQARETRYTNGLGATGSAARGTFSGIVARGLVGSINNPVVAQLRELNSQEREQLLLMQREADAIAEIGDMLERVLEFR